MAGLLTLGARAMFANQAALQTIGQNIANANTPGYSRQSVVLTTAPGQYTGAGFFGKGVDVETVVRSHNAFLTKEAATSKAAASADATRAEQLSRMEKLFPPGTDGLGYAASQFLNAMVDVTSRPSDPSARQVALGRANELAVRFANAGQQLTDLQSGVVSDLRASVTTVNQLAQQIANVNEQIAKVRGSGHTPNDLLDQRERLISSLSEYIAVTTLPADDDTVGVFIGGGQRLVLGSTASTLQVTADPYDPQRAQLSLAEGGLGRALDESVLTGGSMTALLGFQNRDLQDARNMLGQLAAAIGTRINEQNALGLDLSNPPGAGGKIFNVAAPRVLAAGTNARDATGAFTSGVAATISDASQLLASTYTLTSRAAGSYQLTRLSDGLVRDIADGDVVDGVKFSFTPAPPQPGESFRIEPVGSAAVEMRRVMDDPNGIAAASPVTATAAITNNGTLTIGSIYAVDQARITSLLTPDPADPKLQLKLPLDIVFGAQELDGAGQPTGGVLYTLTQRDGTALSGVWKQGQPLGNETGIDLGFELRTNGVPRAGDKVSIGRTIYTATNNGNAKAYLNIQTEPIVGARKITNADGSITDVPGVTINDAYAATISDVGARVQSAKYLSSVSTTVASDAEASRSGESGVNLDEEASRLMQYQQAYQAAAKVLQTAQSLFNELIQLGR
ncbi:flagellar hook-associated protein FlgK [Roseateles sp. DXS20W]|uniref:Flagellar hook-associated protein 1 n=1 Tax=Pelomonas lactea TaxID=3299030 RepID=A0ABW7GIT4_9BURK